LLRRLAAKQGIERRVHPHLFCAAAVYCAWLIVKVAAAIMLAIVAALRLDWSPASP
jgi:hypothetical protein